MFGFALMLAGVLLNRFTRFPLAAFTLAAIGSAIVSAALALDVYRTITGR
jgi:ABC-type Fe3+-siderophore transport system permease subunit